MLKQYSNIEEINSSRQAIEARRFDIEDRGVFQKALYQYQQVELTTVNSSNELHLYSGDSWVTGKQKIDLRPFTDPVYDENGNEIQLTSPVTFNLEKELLKLKLTSGNFKVVVNFFENIVGSYNQQYLAIDEISPDRTEIRLKAIDETNPGFLLSINNYINNVQQTSLTNNPYNCYLLNFSRNQTIKYVNSVVVGKYLFVKLYKPIDRSYKKNFKCWIVREKKNPYIDNIQVTEKIIPTKFNVLTGTNWYASAEQETSNETSLKNWNQLLGSSLQTSQQIIDSYFSGSLGGVKLNIDYTDFNNFVFYSSAIERVSNLKYKLELLEYYSAQSSSISQLSGSQAASNALENKTLYNNLIGGFDDFEKFLFYESSSGLFTQEIPLEDPVVAELTGSYISTIPKTNSTRPYEIVSVTSSIFENWYSGLYESASIYDVRNNNRIIRAVPEFMLLDENNEQLSTFVNMLGQHYDILYSYIHTMTSINSREEHPKIGMPNELLYSVAKQFGWKLTNGGQSEDLWKYTLGTDENGIPLTGSNSVGDASLPSQDITHGIWRRIVNNIPGLLKTKGTKRSIQALLACYGIPQSLITIQEYGGPRIARPPKYEKHNFDYALDLLANPAGSTTVNYTNKDVKSVELRFRTADVLTTPTLPGTMNLYSVGGNDVTLEFSRGTLGTIQINGTSSAEIELFDGGYVNTLLRTGSSGTLEVVANKSKFGKIVATVSASATSSIPNTGTVTLGGTGGGARLQGQLQELRLWNQRLSIDPFNNHTKAPSAYDGNVDAYDELIFRVPLTQKINHATTSSITGVEPNYSAISASFVGWTNHTPYDSVEETYFFDGISLGAGTFDDNKIRLESSVTSSFLNTENRVTRNTYDTAPLDSEQLGVFYSPQTMINEDIIAQLGFTLLDDLIGDPSNIDPYAYPDLVNTSREYWKKYAERNDMNAYLRIFSLFDLSFFKQVEQLLPARADKTVGVLIQPTLIERSRDKVLTEISRESLTFEGTLDLDNDEISGSTKQLEPIVDMLPPITSSTRQLEPILDASITELSGSRNEYTKTLDIFDPESVLSSSRNEYTKTLDVFDPESFLTSSYDDLFASEDISRNSELKVTASADDLVSLLSLVRPATVSGSRISYNTIVIANRDPFEGTQYSRQYLLLSGSTYITGSTPYWESEGISPFITSSRLSEFKKIEYKVPTSPSLNYYFGGNGTQVLDTNQFSTKALTQQPTTTGIGFMGSGVSSATPLWDRWFFTNQKFQRSDNPVADITFKILTTNTSGNTPLSMIGWYPGDDTGSISSYNANEYNFYQQGPNIKVYRKGSQVTANASTKVNGSSITIGQPVEADGSMANGDIINLKFEIKSNGGACLTVVKNGNFATPLLYHEYDSSSTATNLVFGSTFYRQGLSARVEFQSFNIQGTNSKGYLLRTAEFQDFNPRGNANRMFEGTKISSPDFNVDSTDTPDGKPVVEITENSGNRIITQSPGTTGNFEVRE